MKVIRRLHPLDETKSTTGKRHRFITPDRRNGLKINCEEAPSDDEYLAFSAANRGTPRSPHPMGLEEHLRGVVVEVLAFVAQEHRRLRTGANEHFCDRPLEREHFAVDEQRRLA